MRFSLSKRSLQSKEGRLSAGGPGSNDKAKPRAVGCVVGARSHPGRGAQGTAAPRAEPGCAHSSSSSSEASLSRAQSLARTPEPWLQEGLRAPLHREVQARSGLVAASWGLCAAPVAPGGPRGQPRSLAPTAYSDSSPACVSMLQPHDNWPGLGVPAHAGVLPVSASSGPPAGAR